MGTIRQQDVDEHEHEQGQRTSRLPRVAVAVLVALVAALVLAGIYPAIASRFLHSAHGIGHVALHIRVTRVIFLFPFLLLPCMWAAVGFSTVNDWLHRHRWQVGAGIIAAAVLLDINGSSLGVWNSVSGGDIRQNVVFGTPRPIRSDEWLGLTPRAFSQSYSNYSYFNSIQGATPSDMFIIKETPVWTAAEIFRPFHWGYLLLGSSRGLAFYWSSRLVVLFLSVYELCLWLSRGTAQKEGRRDLAVLGAGLVAFSPFIQWWFAVNELPEMIIALSLATLALDRFCTDHAPLHRLGCCLAVAWCAGMFVLTLYPAWQIPLVWIILVLLVAVIVKNWGHIHVTGKDGLSIAVSVIALAGLLATVLVASRQTIAVMLGTSYPGIRHNTGGDYPFADLFTGAATLLSPVLNLSASPTETSAFVDLFPLGIILCVVSWRRSRHVDFLSCALIILDAFFFIYCTVGIPLWLSRITLMTQSYGARARLAFSVINILLLVIGASRLPDHVTESTGLSPRNRALTSGVAIAALTALTTVCTAASTSISGKRPIVLAFVVAFTAVAAWAFLQPRSVSLSTGRVVQEVSVTLIVAAVTLSGLAVNPVQQGSKELTDQPLVASARTIEHRYGRGTWITSGDNSWITANLLTANGIPTINSVAVTPDMARWRTIDPSGKQKDIYNRYAYITVDITHKRGSSPFRPAQTQDHFCVSLTPDDLHKFGVRYVADTSRHRLPDGRNYRLKPIGRSSGGFTIYTVTRK